MSPDEDQGLLQRVVAWLRAGHPVSLVTVVRTWGSAPRPVGSLLALTAQGDMAGSVSGGCVEDDLRAWVRERDTAMPVERLTYGVTREQAGRFGLPCGGRLELIAETLSNAAQCEDLLAQLMQRRSVRRSLDTVSGAVRLAPDDGGAEFEYDGRTLVRVFGPAWRLLLIGAGPIAQHLAVVAPALGYRVMICEPREEYRRNFSAPDADMLAGMPDDVVRERVTDSRCAVVALTHDPRLDDMALMEALASPAFYVGALGSMRNNAARRERLALLGLDRQSIGRMRGPVGLSIGSRSPPEIAVAILAELIAVRRGSLSPPGMDTAAGAAIGASCTLPA